MTATISSLRTGRRHQVALPGVSPNREPCHSQGRSRRFCVFVNDQLTGLLEAWPPKA